MTWEVASFLIVGAVLVAGFAWYERSRPPSQVVALVAALAGLAIVGRIAFAAFPNVKPTTDIVVFAGYALGGAPGFAVGALAALVSNFWFGQGPWTPWQMAGWGLCGVLGAAVALGARNAGRLVLALTCGFAGIAYGALMNFSLMATYGGDLSWRHFLVLEARAIPFEVAHVLGNVVLALIAGPAMVRMLVRFKERFEWTRGGGGEPAKPRRLRPLRGGGLAALLVGLAVLGALAAPPAEASAVSRAAEWLEAQQHPNGGFAAAEGREPGAETTCWAMLGLAAADRNPLDVARFGRTPVDFLRTHLDEIRDAGDFARTILALVAAGVDPRNFGGEDLVAGLLAQRRGNGSYQGWPASSAYAVLALRAAGAAGEAAVTVEWLRKVQGRDGGWGNEPGDAGTPEITGAALQVLTPGSEAVERALSYLRESKRSNGAYAPGNNLSANAQATSWASQGLLATGKDPASFGPGKSSLAYLRGLQADDGSFLQSSGVAGSPVWVTADVLVPLAGEHLPIAAPPREPAPPAPPALPAPPPTSAPVPLPTPGPSTSSGIPPSFEVPPSSSGSASPSLPGGSSGGAGGARGLPALPSAPPGQGPPGAQPGLPPGGGLVPERDPGVAPEPPASTATGEEAAETTGSDASSGSGVAAAILLGLLSGCLLFGTGLAGHRGWMRWRYGL